MKRQLKYQTLEEAYRKEFPRLVSIAKSGLVNQDYAIDCVHDAFAKHLGYCRRKGLEIISGFYLMRDVNRAVEYYNRRDRFENNFAQEFNDDLQDSGRCISGRHTQARIHCSEQSE